MSKNEKSRHYWAENEHMYRYMSSCTGTHGGKIGSCQHVPIHVEHIPVHVEHVPVHPCSSQHVSVHVQHVPVHPNSDQHVPVHVEHVLVHVVQVAPV